jgi:iron-sulfur cluster repair protein YtfE (RIC family)
MSDGYERLMADHADVAEQFARYASTEADGDAHRICEALASHAALEEEAVYPMLRRLVDGGDDLADLADEQHAAIKVLVERVEIAPPADLGPVVGELQALVEEHVAYEEQTLFPAMRDAGIDGDSLGKRLEFQSSDAS